MTWLFVIVVILVLGAGFLAVLGLLGELPPNEPDLRPDSLDGEPAFDIVVRGYRMDEVDLQLAMMQERIDGLLVAAGEVDPDEARDSAPNDALDAAP